MCLHTIKQSPKIIILIGICIAITSIAHNRLIFRKGYKNYKNTKIRILESKTDEGWSYERCSDYKTTGYQFFIDEKVEVIEIRNQNTSRALILRQRKLLCVHLGLASHET